MAYEANRGNDFSNDKEASMERNTQNNANNIRNAADVAIASKNPYAMAAGGAVKVADKLTNGKSSEALGRAMAKANSISPGGSKIQNASNRLSESGASDKIGKAASLKSGGAAGGANAANNAGNAAQTAEQAAEKNKQLQNAANQAAQRAATQAAQNQQSGGGRDSSLPSSSDDNSKKDDDQNDNSSGGGLGRFLGRQAIVAVVTLFAPLILLLLLIVVIIAMVTGVFNDYQDAFGMSNTLGEETGGVAFNASSQEQEDFYDRINDVKLSFQARGKTLDAMKIVAIYHSLTSNGVDISYEDVTTSVIENWANSMFDGNTYSEETFKNNLVNNIFPSYKPGEDQAYYESMSDEVFDYLDRYYNLIGKEDFGVSCASGSGSCSYDIKGFYVPNRGNVVKNIKVSDLKVRLMECGSPYGNGSYTKAISQDLVDFEDYIAGVAYAEIGPSASEELYKTQMVVARSFALSRPTAMGNSAGKKLEEENGKWVLQISSCVADQVFCNIDEGCSYMGGGDGQGGIVRSGKVAGATKTRDPLPSNHIIRRVASATQGEVLVNSQGYIVSTVYNSDDQKNWDSLVGKGLNYKQILLQSYNSGSHNFGATDIKKTACSGEGSSSCASTGDFANWKQGDPQWASVPMGSSGRSLSQIGCLVTSVSMLIAKSGVPVEISPFNPGTFVQFLNEHGGINSGGNFIWGVATQVAPSFKYQGQVSVAGMSRESKLSKIKDIVSQDGVYAVAEVKGNTGQHWVVIDSISGSTINMLDPSSDATDMWSRYDWNNTSTIAYYKVG